MVENCAGIFKSGVERRIISETPQETRDWTHDELGELGNACPVNKFRVVGLHRDAETSANWTENMVLRKFARYHCDWSGYNSCTLDLY
jgi:hypothetical protein